jgi:hypothetical protein
MLKKEGISFLEVTEGVIYLLGWVGASIGIRLSGLRLRIAPVKAREG